MKSMTMLTRTRRFLLWGSCGAALALSCGSDDGKKLVVADAGEAGQAPVAVAGSEAGGSGASVLPIGGAAGEPLFPGGGGGAGQGGAPAGAGGVQAGAGGEGGTEAQPECANDGASCPGGTCHNGACIAPFRLFNTGVDDEGVVLEGAATDPHYTLVESAEASLPGPDAVVTTHIADGYWLAQSEVSKWIAPSPNQSYPGATPCNASGTYVYRTSFDLTGYDPTTLTISGGWAADNSGADIRLNGLGLSLPAGSYTPLSTFTIASGFLPGVNTLDFVVTDVGCPNGLRVELAASSVQLE
jgi:hypothetical protein